MADQRFAPLNRAPCKLENGLLETAVSMTFQRVGEAKLDERLTRDADAFGFLIDGLQQVDGEIHVHALNLTTGPTRLRPINIRGHVGPRVEQSV